MYGGGVHPPPPTPERTQGLPPLREILDAAGDLGRALAECLQARSPEEHRAFLEAHPELLSDEALDLLERLVEEAPDPQTRQKLSFFLNLHRRAREVGFDRAFTEAAKDTVSNLAHGLEKFLTAPTWAETRRVLETHPELLSDPDLSLLERLLEEARQQGDADAVRFFEQHRDLLRRAREMGLERAFAELTKSQPDAVTSQSRVDPAVRGALTALPAEVLQGLADYAALQAQAEAGRPHLWQQALERLMPLLDHPQVRARPLALAVLSLEVGNGFCRLYELSSDEALAGQAERFFRQTLRLAPREQAPYLWATVHHSLGNLYSRRYEHSGDEAHAQAAEAHYRNALQVRRREVAPAHWATVHHSLGNLYSSRYERSGDEAHAQAAESHYRNALQVRRREVAPAQWATVHHSLGNLYLRRYERSGDETHAQAAESHYRRVLEAAEKAGLPAFYPFRAALGLARVAFRGRRWGAVAEAGGQALQALQTLVTAVTGQASKRAWLREAQALPARHAYALARLGRVREAVEALEAGRTFLLREALERRRRDLARLPQLGFPDLYQAYREAEATLAWLDAMPPEARPADWFARRREARKALETAAQAIRERVAARYPEFRFFLRSLPYAEVQGLTAEAGPLVYLLATEHGGLALLVPPQGEPQAVDLPELTAKALRERVQGPDDDPALGGYLGAYFRWRAAPFSREAREAWFRTLEDTLAWLGRVLAPLLSVLTAGSSRQSADSTLPTADRRRLTFLPTSWLTLLPLHAARLPDGSYLLEHVTVAYAPSAHALYHARVAREGSRPLPLLAVENPTGDLPFTPHEVAGVLEFFPEAVRQRLAEREATVEAVQKALPRAGVFHFSGHGQAGWGQAESRLLLADGPLPLSRIFDLDLERVRLAVLSACETGVPDPQVREEVLGLPAGLLLAEVPGVVGSLWAVNDLSTALLMLRFYHGLRREGLPGPEGPARGPGVDAAGVARGEAGLPATSCAGTGEAFATGGRAPSALCFGRGPVFLPAPLG